MSSEPRRITSTIGIWAYARTPSDHFGGVETYVLRIAQELMRRGATVVLHCLATSNAGWYVENGEFAQGTLQYRTDTGMLVVVPENGPGPGGCLAENVLAAKAAREEVILAFGTRDGFVFSTAQHGARTLGIPLISFVYFTSEERSYRGQYASRTRSIAGTADESETRQLAEDSEAVIIRLVAESALVVVPTYYVRGQIQDLVGYDPHNVDVVYHGVDDSVVGRVGSGDRRGMLHISRLTLPFAAHKNFFWTLEFARHLNQLGHLDQMTIVGDGGGKDMAEQFAEQNDLLSRVRFAGAVEPTDLSAMLGRAQVLLVPSMMEAGSTTTVDAVMAGCLPIGAAAAALPELFEALGLSQFLIETSERTRGRIRSIEPSLEHALEIVTTVAQEPAAVDAAMTNAQRVARKRFGLHATTTELLEKLWQKNLIR
ncbi:glycosyltransferase family 4 protein [Kribbella solani]|uniref:glycosyltransferase family 4 protein n=1 Tax=Kribbella solani TaxID=236067 RepID=UPI0029AF7B89|nr:glycosyltransferase family 4 protein [Kribbella solani]MDX2972178.1 glycosyltransferase family 4 protein [Kribbella solani]